MSDFVHYEYMVDYLNHIHIHIHIWHVSPKENGVVVNSKLIVCLLLYSEAQVG